MVTVLTAETKEYDYCPDSVFVYPYTDIEGNRLLIDETAIALGGLESKRLRLWLKEQGYTGSHFWNRSR